MCKKKKISLQWSKLLLLLLTLSLTIPANSLSRDGVLLLSFKNALTRDPLSLLSSWYLNDDTPCNWHGVTCSPSSRVTALSLPNSRLLGPLHPDLGLLDQLISLNLTSNSLNSSIPADFFRATTLRVLDLSDNRFSGELPERVGELQGLQVLDLSGNDLAGEFPGRVTGIGNLTVISLRSNGFSGGIPSGLGRVRVLDLSSNSFNGSLPEDFGGRSIRYLNISGNNISGVIPAGFGRDIPENSTLDFSYNNFTGKIPNSRLFLSQKTASFLGNPDLCGAPLPHPCSISISPSPTFSPATAAKPNYLRAEPEEGVAVSPPGNQLADHEKSGKSGLKPVTIAVIVAGDLAGISILAVVLLVVHRKRRNKGSSTRIEGAWSSTSPSTSMSSETKGIAKWSCIRKTRGGDEESSYSSSSDEEETTEGSQNAAFGSKEGRNEEQRGTLVTVDGEELEVETLLKAAAYILGASGPSILYKAVLEDGSALAVRRVGEGATAAERLKEFESQVRSVAKVSGGHPNMVRIRGFYWGPDERLLIYEFVPNGSLANARGYRKAGSSSPSHLPWESRIKIAKGVARALAYLHDKKHVHGNLKPTNILLDADFEPKLADFGLDRLAPSSASRPGCSSTRHFGSKRSTASRESFQDFNPGATPSPSASSIGCASPYHPPESLRSLQRPGAKWDVYSFGVVFLELVTGRVVQGSEDAATWMAGVVGEDNSRVLRMADVAIRADLEGKEEVLLTCVRLGCSCVASAPQKRPSMKEALQVLDKLPIFSSPLPYF